MIDRIVSRVMFCPPLRMREIEAPLSGGEHLSPKASLVGDPGRLRYSSSVMPILLHGV